MLCGDAHRIEKRAVIYLEDVLIRHEELQAGNAFVNHGGDFCHDGFVEVRDGHGGSRSQFERQMDLARQVARPSCRLPPMG